MYLCHKSDHHLVLIVHRNYEREHLLQDNIPTSYHPRAITIAIYARAINGNSNLFMATTGPLGL